MGEAKFTEKEKSISYFKEFRRICLWSTHIKYVLMNKIALGTVQFGMRYGINSLGHQVESH